MTAISKSNSIPAMSNEAIDYVRAIEANAKTKEQVFINIQHMLHGGMYARSMVLPAGVMLTGALIKIPTILLLSGDVMVFTGDDVEQFSGDHVLACSAGRKQAFYANSDTHMTMIFPSVATGVEGAESEFTDEVSLLSSRGSDAQNVIVITGE